MTVVTDPDTVLMTAILSMDIYERDPLFGPADIRLKLPASSLGPATFISSLYEGTITFGAVAWTWNGQTIITYEGTIVSELPTTAFSGYGIGLGFPGGPDAEKAIDFYQDVANDSDDNLDGDYRKVIFLLTGHSSGGGLAGYVGAIYGQQGVLFDNEYYAEAASEAYEYSIGGSVSADGISYTDLEPDPKLYAAALTRFKRTAALARNTKARAVEA